MSRVKLQRGKSSLQHSSKTLKYIFAEYILPPPRASCLHIEYTQANIRPIIFVLAIQPLLDHLQQQQTLFYPSRLENNFTEYSSSWCFSFNISPHSLLVWYCREVHSNPYSAGKLFFSSGFFHGFLFGFPLLQFQNADCRFWGMMPGVTCSLSFLDQWFDVCH